MKIKENGGEIMFFDICVIGGGAAGMMAAITAKEAAPSLNICLVEQLDRVGKKIALTGNGRCNITNKNITADNYYGSNPLFAMPFFERFSVHDTCNFFHRIGTPVVFEGDKGYPRSLQAASVVDALRFRIDELKIKTFLGNAVSDITKNGDNFIISCNEKITAKTVIIAAGLLSGGVKLGSDGKMLEILGKKLKFSKPSPAIVQLKTDTDFVRQLKGIKVDAEVKLLRGGREIKTDFGETLFCDYGLSGPPVLQLSGHAKAGDEIVLDLMPDYDFSSLCALLSGRKKVLSSRKNDEFLSGLLNKRLGQVVIKRAGLLLSGEVCTISDAEIKKICAVAKGFRCTVLGNTGFQNSQVSMGGIYTDQLDKETLMVKAIPGLFLAGEIVDITGDCGGYNLQWAWSSGYAAALGAVEFLK